MDGFDADKALLDIPRSFSHIFLLEYQSSSLLPALWIAPPLLGPLLPIGSYPPSQVE